MGDKNKIIENIVNAVGSEVKLPIEVIRNFLVKVERKPHNIALAKDIDEARTCLNSLEGRITDLCDFVTVPPVHFRDTNVKEFVAFHLNLALTNYERNFYLKLMVPELSVRVDLLKLNEAFKALLFGISGYVNSGKLNEVSFSARVRDEALRFSFTLKGKIAEEFKMEMFLPAFLKKCQNEEECKYLSKLPSCYKHILAADGNIDFKAEEGAITIHIAVPTTTPEMISNYFVFESNVENFGVNANYRPDC